MDKQKPNRSSQIWQEYSQEQIQTVEMTYTVQIHDQLFGNYLIIYISNYLIMCMYVYTVYIYIYIY